MYCEVISIFEKSLFTVLEEENLWWIAELKYIIMSRRVIIKTWTEANGFLASKVSLKLAGKEKEKINKQYSQNPVNAKEWDKFILHK